MCYLVAKNVNVIGCLSLQTTHGKHLADFKRKLIQQLGTERIQLITISRPSAYGEYEPYEIVDTEEEFSKAVLNM